jgi:DNA-nicking Smr family endonuclease
VTEEAPFEYPITDTLDLHQFAPRDMQAALEAWLDEAHARGFRAVRVVHGRGIGYQREMVRRVLRASERVAAFHDAPADSGGWGATVATLR